MASRVGRKAGTVQTSWKVAFSGVRENYQNQLFGQWTSVEMSSEKTAQDYLHDARRHFDAKDHAAALQIAEDGLAQFPFNASLCDLKIATLRAMEGPEVAVAFSETLPRELLASWLVNRMVVLLIETERLQEANDLLNEATAETRARQPYQMARIRVTEILEGHEAALYHAQAFCRAHPDRPELVLRAAGLLEDLDRCHEAIDCLDPLITKDAPWPHRKQFARVCKKAGYPIWAISVMEDAERDLQNPPPGLFYDLARALEEKGRPEEALAVLDRSLQRYSNNSYQCWMKARILRGLGRAEEALDFVFSLAPEALDEQLQNMVCSLLIEIERHEEAEEFIASLPKDAQNRPAILLSRLRICHAKMGPSEALEFAEQSIGFCPADQFLALEIAHLLQLAGRNHDAISILSPFATDAVAAPVAGKLARLYLATGQPDEASRLLGPLADAKATNADMQSLLVQAYEEDGQQTSALDAVEKGLQRFQGDPNLLAQYWRLLSGLQGREAAIQACYCAQTDWPGSVQVQIKALQFLSRMEDEDGCKNASERIEHADPDNQQGAVVRANYLLNQKNAVGARNLLLATRKKNGSSASLDRTLAVACHHLGLNDEAMSLIEPLACGSESNAYAVIELVKFRQAVCDYDGARAALDSIPVRNRDDEKRRRDRLADMALGRADVESALELAQATVLATPDDVYSWSRKAQAELMAGDVESAWESHRTWVNLRWTQDNTGKLTKKVKRSLNGQIMNEYRLLGDDPALALSRPGLDQRIAAREYKRSLMVNPSSTALALGLMVSLRRCGEVLDQVHDAPELSPAPDRIPRKIFQFWDASDPPHQVADLMEENRLANPGYSYRRFDQKSAREYLQEKGEQAAIEAFRLAPNAAGKADIFRLVVLWHEGGIYLDADDRCTVPLDTFIDHSLRFLGYQEPQMSVGNSFLAVQPRDPIIRAALDDAVNAFGGPQGEILWLSTGPGAMTRAVAKVGTDEAGLLIPGVCIVSINLLRNGVWPHLQLSYKSTERSWIRSFLNPDVGIVRATVNRAGFAGG